MAEDVIKHIEHALKVCGEDHVGIGTDGVISAVNVTPEFVKNSTTKLQNVASEEFLLPANRMMFSPLLRI